MFFKKNWPYLFMLSAFLHCILILTLCFACTEDNEIVKTYKQQLIDPVSGTETDVCNLSFSINEKDNGSINEVVKFMHKNVKERCVNGIKEGYFDVFIVDSLNKIYVAHCSKDDCTYITYFQQRAGMFLMIEHDFDNYDCYFQTSNSKVDKKLINDLVSLCKKKYYNFYDIQNRSINRIKSTDF